MTLPYSILSKKENAHEDPIYCCDWVKTNFSGDSATTAKDLIVTGSLDGSVKVWVLQNNKLDLISTLVGHTMGVVSVKINPVASSVVSSSLDSNLIVWNLNTGAKLSEISTGETDVWKLCFSPDGGRIATGGHTGNINVYSVQYGEVERTLDTRAKFILSIDWSKDGNYIATGSENGIISVMDFYQGKLLHTIEAHSKSIRSIVFSHCSTKIASASNDGLVKIYGVIGAGLQCQLDHKCWATSVCFSPDGTRVATGAADGSVRVALSTDLSVIATFKEHTDTVWGVHFDNHSKKSISVSKDACINLYETPPPPPAKK